jgi:hypothetical protein
MGAITFEAVIAMPRAHVWAKLRDLQMARHYVAGVTNIELNSAQREGVGASRKVFMQGRQPVDETVIAWQEGRGMTLKIHNGAAAPGPFKWATFQYALEEQPSGHTRVQGTFAYEMAGGIFGRLFDALALRRAIARSHAKLGENMKRFYETGQITNAASVSGG